MARGKKKADKTPRPDPSNDSQNGAVVANGSAQIDADTDPEAVVENGGELHNLRLLLEQKDQQLKDKDDIIASLKQNATSTQPDSSKDETIKQLESTIEKLKLEQAPQTDTQIDEKIKALEQERDDTKASYDNLLNKLSSMKTVFTRMKEAQEELGRSNEQNEQLAGQISQLEQTIQELNATNSTLKETNEALTEQANDLNSECERLSTSITSLTREYQEKEQILQDEKYDLENQVSRLTKRLNDIKAESTEYELIKGELKMEIKELTITNEELQESLSLKQEEIDKFNDRIEGLQAKLSEAQEQIVQIRTEKDGNIEGLNNIIATINTEKDSLHQKLDDANERIVALEKSSTKIKELEVEVNNKQLLLGKARHEAIILNEHLSKALSMLKAQANSADHTIDKELISNVLINFLQIPRGDTKKFEALQLISSLLSWDESKKIASGLSHNQGNPASTTSNGKPVRESFVSLWTDFLERESTK